MAREYFLVCDSKKSIFNLGKCGGLWPFSREARALPQLEDLRQNLLDFTAAEVADGTWVLSESQESYADWLARRLIEWAGGGPVRLDDDHSETFATYQGYVVVDEQS